VGLHLPLLSPEQAPLIPNRWEEGHHTWVQSQHWTWTKSMKCWLSMQVIPCLSAAQLIAKTNTRFPHSSVAGRHRAAPLRDPCSDSKHVSFTHISSAISGRLAARCRNLQRSHRRISRGSTEDQDKLKFKSWP
jgi:hypothetical protein